MVRHDFAHDQNVHDVSHPMEGASLSDIKQIQQVAEAESLREDAEKQSTESFASRVRLQAQHMRLNSWLNVLFPSYQVTIQHLVSLPVL